MMIVVKIKKSGSLSRSREENGDSQEKGFRYPRSCSTRGFNSFNCSQDLFFFSPNSNAKSAVEHIMDP